MKLIEKSVKILDNHLCDHCLGSQFAGLLSGFSNKERGKIIRNFLAMLIENGEVDYSKINPSNFYGFKFKQNKEFSKKIKKSEKCWLCENVFDKIDSIVKKASKKLEKIEFNSLLVGSKLPEEIFKREEKIWEKIGIEWCESIKNEINRKIGIRLGNIFNKPADFKRPDVVVLADFVKNKVELQINSLFIFGFYKKMVRGIPQSKWGTPGKYKTSIQEIIAKPIVKATKGKNNKFSGSGREDIDARCLDWRAFVIEIIEPKIRKIDFKKMQRIINKSKKVKVRGLRHSDKSTVVRIKTETGEKTYRVRVKLSKKVEKKDLKKLKKLIGFIEQRTPNRVSHRRADIIRKRMVKDLKYKQINKKILELRIKASAGLYIKELVTGDKGRTKPSVSEILGCEAIPKELDVIHIEKPKNL